MSRFAYHIDDDPGEGGVVSADPKGSKPHARGGNGLAIGVPGPTELLLDIGTLARTPGMRYTHRFDIPAGAIDDLGSVTPVTGTLILNNTGAALLLNGGVTATLEMECTRCLSPTQQQVETEIEESLDLIPENTAYAQGEVKIVDENVELRWWTETFSMSGTCCVRICCLPPRSSRCVPGGAPTASPCPKRSSKPSWLPRPLYLLWAIYGPSVARKDRGGEWPLSGSL